MRFKPIEDIPDVDTKRSDFRKINALMLEVVTSTRIALRHPYNLTVKPDYEAELRQYLSNQLLTYVSTHQSIQLLVSRALRKKHYSLVSDSVSLCREQIEKIYSIALTLTNPHKWVKRHLRADWQHACEDYLLQVEENSHNPRYQDFINKYYVEYLEIIRHARYPNVRRETIVSDFAKRVLIHNWNHPGSAPPPAWLKKVWFAQNKRRAKRGANVRDYIDYYFGFPTPGKAIRHIRGKQIKPFLSRWYREYAYHSEYSHAALAKAVIPFASESRHVDAVERVATMGRKLLSRVIHTDFCAIGSACALIVFRLRDGYGSRHYLEQFWAHLSQSSLLGKTLWDTYVKHII